MAKKETASQTAPLLPMLKTVEQMSKVTSMYGWNEKELSLKPTTKPCTRRSPRRSRKKPKRKAAKWSCKERISL